jgi:hypothetical protein
MNIEQMKKDYEDDLYYKWKKRPWADLTRIFDIVYLSIRSELC